MLLLRHAAPRLAPPRPAGPGCSGSRLRWHGSHVASRRSSHLARSDGARAGGGSSADGAGGGAAAAQTEEARFHDAYSKAFTMSQLYVGNRPAPVPAADWETRRRKRDMEDILLAARRRGKDAAAVQANLAALEALLPDLVNLNKMKPADWVALSEDVTGAANKLILLKSAYPDADVFSIVARRPRTLLESEQRITESAAAVKALLSAAESVDEIIQAVPELTDPATLSRSLSFLSTSFPGQDPVALLQENPGILLNLGESNVEDSAEYGELTTKD
ncbi:hypothetical protein HT031_006225 [Scenedesmus sp. PABB004]|nr:hypothetical protein HT031_006225 [Scenedesmus sp. PABB004]